MAISKIYLHVPYMEKDAAKALGAQWDAKNKKWYVSDNLDLSLFSKWHNQAPSTTSSTKTNFTNGVITYAKDKNFVAYCGDEPPWN